MTTFELQRMLNLAAAFVFIILVGLCIYMIGLGLISERMENGAKIFNALFFGAIAIVTGWLLIKTIRSIRTRQTGWGIPAVGFCLFMSAALLVLREFF